MINKLIKPKKIVIDARMYGSLSSAGIGVYAEELIRHIVKADMVDDFYLLLRESESEIAILQANVHQITTKIAHYSLEEQVLLPQLLWRLQPDLVHFTNFNMPIIGPCFPSVVTVHDLTLLFFSGRQENRLKRILYPIVMGQSLRRAKKIIAISEYTKQDIIKHFQIPAEKIEVIYEGVPQRLKKIEDKKELQRMRAQFNITDPFLLYVGQWRKHKNLINLIRAFHLVLRRNPGKPFQLVLVGKQDSTHFPEVVRTIKRLNLTEKVVLTGYIPDEDLSLFYSAAEAFVFPSLYEGFGIPPLEAMRVGLPVVASNASCIPEVLGPAATYFDPLDVEDMAQKMSEVLRSYTLKRKLSEAGKKWVTRYSYNKMAKQTLDLYRQILQDEKEQP